MANVIKEEESRFSDPDSLEAKIREYMKLKESIDFMTERTRILREQLFEALDADGFEDDRGNVLIELDTPIEGVIRLEKQRRTKRKLDEEQADAIIKERQLEEDVYKTVRVIDEDALMAQLYQDKITEEELDAMFPIEVTWALTPKKK